MNWRILEFLNKICQSGWTDDRLQCSCNCVVDRNMTSAWFGCWNACKNIVGFCDLVYTEHFSPFVSHLTIFGGLTYARLMKYWSSRVGLILSIFVAWIYSLFCLNYRNKTLVKINGNHKIPFYESFYCYKFYLQCYFLRKKMDFFRNH